MRIKLLSFFLKKEQCLGNVLFFTQNAEVCEGHGGLSEREQPEVPDQTLKIEPSQLPTCHQKSVVEGFGEEEIVYFSYNFYAKTVHGVIFNILFCTRIKQSAHGSTEGDQKIILIFLLERQS